MTDLLELPTEAGNPMYGGRPSTRLTLAQLAERINVLSQEIVDKRLEFCLFVAVAQDRVSQETNLTFAEWARQNLHKPNGKPWSLWTLYKCASFGRDPAKLEHQRAVIAKNGTESREARRMLAIATNSIAEQVNLLMIAWEKAEEPARR